MAHTRTLVGEFPSPRTLHCRHLENTFYQCIFFSMNTRRSLIGWGEEMGCWCHDLHLVHSEDALHSLKKKYISVQSFLWMVTPCGYYAELQLPGTGPRRLLLLLLYCDWPPNMSQRGFYHIIVINILTLYCCDSPTSIPQYIKEGVWSYYYYYYYYDIVLLWPPPHPPINHRGGSVILLWLHCTAVPPNISQRRYYHIITIIIIMILCSCDPDIPQ